MYYNMYTQLRQGISSMKHFSANNIDELKTQYKELCKLNHPDIGGDAEVMKEINAEYDEVLKTLEAFNEDNIQYRSIIETLSNINGINIEICGSWVWVSGNTFPVKNEIKNAGLKFSGKKKMWYWHPEGYKRNHRKNFSIDEIRQIHGSKIVKDSNKRLTA